MEFIDTHTHLYATEFDTDRQMVVERAISSGVSYMLLPNINSHTVEDMLRLCKVFPEHCLPMIGLHPTSVNEDYQKELAIVEACLPDKRFIAIGEVGIDLYWDKTFLKQQLDAFSFQIDIARKHSLPLVIHCRESFEEIIKIVREKFNGDAYSGVFHSFPGTAEQAKQVIDFGFKIGINGVVTFKKSGQRELVEATPLEHIILETDAPYLTPVPYRGKRNESSYLTYIAQQIADIKKVSVAEVAKTTTNTARILFKLGLK
jgi:TatD DNase family protein